MASAAASSVAAKLEQLVAKQATKVAIAYKSTATSNAIASKPKLDAVLSAVTFELRARDPSMVAAWRFALHGVGVDGSGATSPCLQGLSEEEVNTFRKSFVIPDAGDIFASVDGSGAARTTAVVSPANSWGDMTGGIDKLYLTRFGGDMMERLQAAIVAPPHYGELLVGAACIVATNDKDPVRYLVAAPTMRVPTIVRGTVAVFLAFRAVLMALREHNTVNSSASSEKSGAAAIIQRVLCPGLGTGVGLMPAVTCAVQMGMAFRQQVLGRRAACLAEAQLEHEAMVKSREEVVVVGVDKG